MYCHPSVVPFVGHRQRRIKGQGFSVSTGFNLSSATLSPNLKESVCSLKPGLEFSSYENPRWHHLPKHGSFICWNLLWAWLDLVGNSVPLAHQYLLCHAVKTLLLLSPLRVLYGIWLLADKWCVNIFCHFGVVFPLKGKCQYRVLSLCEHRRVCLREVGYVTS